jgi:mRNA interferase HigB
MRVISRRTLREFIRQHPNAESSLEQWYRIVRRAGWNSLADVRRVFPHADHVGRRTVFNIAGNNYRLIARINYRGQKLYVLAVLTHGEYDKEQWK